MLWLKSRFGRVLEGASWLLDAAIGFGLISGAAVAVVFGKFLLAGVLAAFALGAYLRFKRKRAEQTSRGN